MIDVFPFCNELDVLEVRLHALAPYVRRFVLAESEQTHSGKPKPLYFEENRARFADFDITSVVIPSLTTADPWKREEFGRSWLLGHLGDGDDDETVLISDVDEIPDMTTYDGGEGVFRNRVYLYYFNCYANFDTWGGTFAVRRGHIDPRFILMRERKRCKQQYPVVGEGWHFTSMGTEQQIIDKLDSFAHQELNTTEYQGRIRSGRAGLQTWGYGERQACCIEDPRGPAWLLENREQYPHLWVKA